MITWDGSRFWVEEENLKVFSSDFPFVTDLLGEAEKAARHARETGCQIKSAAAFLRAWMKRADLAASARKRSSPVCAFEVEASRAASEVRAAKEREAWLEAHCLNRAGLPVDVYNDLLRKEIQHMVRKGALR